MANPVNAKYKIYSGSDWIEYHFTTNAAQVSTTTQRKFLTTDVTINNNTAGTTGAKVTLGSGNAANIEIDGAHITGQAAIDTTNSNSALHYIAATDSVAVALGKLDRATKVAYDHTPSDVLTTSNYSTTLNSAYQALDQDLTDIAGLTGAGLLRRNSTGTTWTLDTTSYVPSTRTVNGKALSQNISITSNDISYAGPDNSWQFTVKQGIDLAISTANGNAKSVVINATQSNLDTAYANADFNSTNNSISITATSSSKYKLKNYSGTDVELSSLKLGDTIFITETNVPDRWLADVETSGSNKIYHFERLETYNLIWGAIANKPTLGIDGQTVTIGNNSVTVPALAPATSGSSNPNNGTATTAARSDHTHNYIPLSGTAALSGNIVPNANNSKSLGSSTYNFYSLYTREISSNADLRFYSDGDVAISAKNNGGVIYLKGGSISWATISTANLQAQRAYSLPDKGGTFAMTSDLSDFRKVTVASTAPASPTSGDIWIEA